MLSRVLLSGLLLVLCAARHEKPPVVEGRKEFGIAIDAFNQRDWLLAQQAFQEVLHLPDGAPHYRASCYFCLGLIAELEGRDDFALSAYDSSAILHKTPHVLVKKAMVLSRTHPEHIAESLRLIREALELDPGHLWSQRNEVTALSKLERMDEAAEKYQELEYDNPGNVAPVVPMAEVAMLAGDPGPNFLMDRWLECDLILADNEWTEIDLNTCELLDPERFLINQVREDPTDGHNWHKLGKHYKDHDQLFETVQAMRQAVRLDPKDAPSFALMGGAFADAEYYVEAVRPLERGLALHRGDMWARANIVLSLSWTCQWKKLAFHMQQFSDYLQVCLNGDVVSFPAPAHMILTISTPPTELPLWAYRKWVDLWSKEMTDRLERGAFWQLYPPLPADRRLRLGYVSGAGFQKSPGSAAIRGIFALHDRRRYEVHCFALKPDKKANMLRSNVSGSCDKFYELGGIANNMLLAERVNAGKPHVLIDVTGFSGDHRIKFLAHAPAPTSFTWLEYPGTLGESTGMDGIITDPIASPPEMDIVYSEKLLAVPPPYLPNDYHATVSVPPRSQQPLWSDKQTFCALHHVWKMDPATFAAWMALLKHVNNSVLRLQECAPQARQSLRDHAASHGVDPTRLVFNPKIGDYYEHIDKLSLCSLFLDAPKYNAHTSAADGLWGGAPVLTLPHELMVTRGASCLLASHGVTTTIARTMDEYGQLALAIGGSQRNLEAVRGDFQRKRFSSNMFNTTRWTCAFEKGARMLWETKMEAGKRMHMIPTDGCTHS